MGVSEKDKGEKHGWTTYLMLNCLVVCLASFQFGYNIGVTNLPTQIIKDYYLQDKVDLLRNGTATFLEKKAIFDEKYAKYSEGLAKYLDGEKRYAEGIAKVKTTKELLAKYEKENQTAYDIIYEKALETNMNYTEMYGMIVEDFLKDARYKLNIANKTLTNATKLIEEGKIRLKEGSAKIESGNQRLSFAQDLLWAITNCLFVLGGMIGAITSKPFSDRLGRKKSIIFHNVFIFIAVAFIAASALAPETFRFRFVLIMASRLFSGVQGGMACTLVPNYLNEISPTNLRGATGVVSQLCITLGIAVSQLLGFRQLFGTANLWMYLLYIPVVPSLLNSLLLLIFFSETPAGLMRNGDRERAELILKRLRNSDDVEEELSGIKIITNDSGESDGSLTIMQLFKSRELRWPLLTSLVIQLSQQLCGINAVFFYSESIFKVAGIDIDNIQYAVLSTGVINVLATIIAIPLIDTLGRKPLLVYPMIIIIFDFILLTLFLVLQEFSTIFSFLSIACVILFIICFAVGLGPIPFVYVSECFRPNAKSAAIAISMLTNWSANLLLTLTFPFLAKLLKSYVFLVFTVIVALATVFIIRKVPETRGKETEQIIRDFNPQRLNGSPDETGKKLMPDN